MSVGVVVIITIKVGEAFTSLLMKHNTAITLELTQVNSSSDEEIFLIFS